MTEDSNYFNELKRKQMSTGEAYMKPVAITKSQQARPVTDKRERAHSSPHTGKPEGRPQVTFEPDISSPKKVARKKPGIVERLNAEARVLAIKLGVTIEYAKERISPGWRKWTDEKERR